MQEGHLPCLPAIKGYTHSNILAWKIPCTEDLGGLQSTGLQIVRHDWESSLWTFWTHKTGLGVVNVPGKGKFVVTSWNYWANPRRHLSFPGSTSGKEPTCQCRRRKRHGLDPWVGKFPWRREWVAISCLENPMDRGTWWATVHRVAQSQIRLKFLSTHSKEIFEDSEQCEIADC